MSGSLSDKAARFQNVLREHGIDAAVREFPKATRTALQAAEAVDCEVDQIVKSLVFRSGDTGRPLLILTSGANRVNETALGSRISVTLAKADAAYVREATGYAIGGVPPFGHLNRIETYVDEELTRFDVVWAAAGTPNAIFPLAPKQLLAATRGKLVFVG